MERYWRHLSLEYVTEESDDAENPNGIIEHKLSWRSNSKIQFNVVMTLLLLFVSLFGLELNEFMCLLDNRLAAKQKTQPMTSLVAKKVRKEGSLSESLPPSNAPVWAVQCGKFVHFGIVYVFITHLIFSRSQ